MGKLKAYKNFNLGTELSVAGAFIYDGLRNFDEIKNFNNTEGIFSFLYNVSVGIERLAKICIVLIEHHDNRNDQQKFEESLKHHNISGLIERVRKSSQLNFSKKHNAFISILTEFYKKQRYGRFISEKVFESDTEKDSLIMYLERYANVTFETQTPLVFVRNNNKMKEFIGKVIGTICERIYETIEEQARKQSLYTYEVEFNTKAYKIFTRREYTFFEEKIAWKELLIYLLNSQESHKLLNLLREIEPIELDSGLLNEYLCSFNSDVDKFDLMDEITNYYEDNYGKDELKNRKEVLEVLTNKNIIWNIDDEDI